jgi:KUP system potassium uptake protein
MAEPQHTSSDGAAHSDADSEYASEKMPPKRLQRFDSLHMEAGKIPGGSTPAAKVWSPATLVQLNNNSSIP